MNRNYEPVSVLFFQTVKFFLNGKTLKYLFVFPVLLLGALAVYEKFYPIYGYAETANLQIELNVSSILTLLSVLAFITTEVTWQSADIALFGRGEHSFFVPRLNKKYGLFLLVLAKMTLFSLVLAGTSVFALTKAFDLFVKTFVFPVQIKAMLVLALFPFFMIRTGLCLVGSVAGEKIGLFQSWQITRIFGWGYFFMYVAAVLLPCALCLSCTRLLPQSGIVTNFAGYLSVVSSGAFQGVYLVQAFARAKKDAIL